MTRGRVESLELDAIREHGFRTIVTLAGVALTLIFSTHAPHVHGQGFASASPDPAITLISNDPNLTNPGAIATDGVNLYVGVGPSILSVPISGGPATTLYADATASCVVGLARLEGDLYWIDPDGDADATAIFKGPTAGGPITQVYSGLATGGPIVEGADIASDGSKLYMTDSVQGQVHSINPDGSSITFLGARFGGFLDDAHPSTITEDGGVLYIVDSGFRPDVSAPEVLTAPSTDGSFVTLHSGAPLVGVTDVAVGNDTVFIADQHANTIWKLPVTGGTPTALASGAPFVQIHGLVYWNGALYVTDTGNVGSADGPGAIYRLDLNAAPTPADDAYAVGENSTLTVPASGVLSNDLDADGDTLHAVLVSRPSIAQGSVTLNDDGSFAFVPAANFRGAVSFTYKANDGIAESDVATVTVTVKAAPVINWTNQANIVYGTALSGIQLNATANVPGTFEYGPEAGTILDAGDGRVLSVLFRPTDAESYSTATKTVVMNVIRAATTAALTLSKSPQQYSDLETFKATVTSAAPGQPADDVTFMVGTQAMGTAPLKWTGAAYEATLPDVALVERYPFTGQLQPATFGRTVRAVFNNVSPNFTVMNPTRTLVISKEDARAIFTGTLMDFTPNVGVSTATVRLSATIKDISATTEAGTDTNPGDVRHIPVIFFNRDTGLAISPTVNVTLPDPNKTSSGIATYDWQTNIAANAQTFRIGILIDRYYVRYNAADDVLVTVAKPITSGFMTGGGHLVLSSSGGLKPGDRASANHVGFAITYTGAGSNPVGHFNTLVRSNGVYQVKGTTFTSLKVNGKTATFTGRGSIYNVTNGSSLMDSGATFTVSVTDGGDSGSADTIAITVRNGAGAVWFSSNWSGTASVEQLLQSGYVKLP